MLAPADAMQRQRQPGVVGGSPKMARGKMIRSMVGKCTDWVIHRTMYTIINYIYIFMYET